LTDQFHGTPVLGALAGRQVADPSLKFTQPLTIARGQLGLGEDLATLLERLFDLRRPRALQAKQLAGQI
jgi:hypothetical protein